MKEVTHNYIPIRESKSKNPPSERFDIPLNQDFSFKLDGLTFQEKRRRHIIELATRAKMDSELIKINDPFGFTKRWKEMGCTPNHYAKYTSSLMFWEHKYSEHEVIGEGYNYDGNFNPKWNLRSILIQDAVLEVESPDYDFNIKGVNAIIDNLIKYQIGFSVFYAEGMRTPHIHIYNLFRDIADWDLKEEAMKIFVSKVVPFEFSKYIDRSLFGEHIISLEYSKHWKYGTMNKLIFKYNPLEEVKCN